MSKEVPSRVREVGKTIRGFAFNVAEKTMGVEAYRNQAEINAYPDYGEVDKRITEIFAVTSQTMFPATWEFIISKREKVFESKKNALIFFSLFLVEIGIDSATLVTALGINLAILAAKPTYNAGVATVFESIRTIKNRKSAVREPVVPAS